MSEVPHQHENERTLYRTKRSVGVLVVMLCKSLFQGAVAGFLFGLLGSAGIALAFSSGVFSFVPVIVIIVLTIIILSYRRYVIWRETTLTISTQRIMYHHYDSLFQTSTHTIRWDRYQESSYSAGVFDRLTNTGILIIHFGTAGAEKELEITRLSWAKDLKHYLDKIQNLKASHTVDVNIPYFVPAKKGKRDKAILSYSD